MKKSLVAAAVLTAFAGSAFAANVTLYGVVDLSLLYTRVDSDLSGADAVNKLELKSSNQAGSRWGLKGEEKINDELTVGFILESGFNADTGASDNSARLFRREASLYLKGPSFGKLAFGRMGSLNQGASSWGKAGEFSAFSTSWGDTYAVQGTQFIRALGGQYDNMISYQTPTVAGLTGYAQYSMATGSSTATGSADNKSTEDQYGLIGLTYKNGPIGAVLTVDWTNYASISSSGVRDADIDDGFSVTGAVNYDFGVAKVYLAAQYFDNGKVSELSGNFKNVQLEGYGVALSASAPVFGGKLMAGVGYVDASETDNTSYDKADFKRYIVSLGYDYNLSKRTNVYTVISYQKDEYEYDDNAADPSALGFTVGIRHRF